MKSIAIISILALAHSAYGLNSLGAKFGPDNCVKLSRSAAGSCVISTGCKGLDTSSTEFAFDCIDQSGKGDVVRHSFGVGGFEADEEFDTDVKCGRCAPLLSQQHQQPAAKKKKVAHVEANLKPAPALVTPKSEAEQQHEVVPGAVGLRAKATTGAQAQASMWPFSSAGKAEKAEKGTSEAIKYGPDSCVSVWRSAAGHCIMSTECDKKAIAEYEFGLVCVDKKGSPVKHLFGKNSFDPKETFDTLIKCEQCLGLEEIPDTVNLAGEVASMAKEIKSITDAMKDISVNVNMLNLKVFPPKAAAPAPGPAPAAPAPAAAPTKFLVHRRAHQKHSRGNLRRHHHHHHHRHHRRAEDDDDDDREDDYDRSDDRDDQEDRDSAEEPQADAVYHMNAVALKMQQAQAAQKAEAARVQTIPMNEPSRNTNAHIPAPPQAAQSDDDDDEWAEDSEEPQTEDVNSINAVALKLQQDQAARQAEAASIQTVPMNSQSQNTNAHVSATEAAQSRDAESDEEDSDEGDEEN
jgi:hypothetical protein